MVPGARSVALGCWVAVGGRDESDELAGASHFLEHLLFKGTANRSASELSRAVDATGGDLNAFTTPEYTAYHARLPEGHLDLALDVLSEVVWSPALRDDDIEAERSVILEELLMNEDELEDRVLRLLDESLFPGNPLGREVLGDRASIEAMRPEAVRAFHDRWYRPANVVVAAAGAVDHAAVVEGMAARLPAGLTGGERPERRAPVAPLRPFVSHKRRSEQAHLAIGVRGLRRDDPDRYALAVANQVLGDGTSSRLFTTVREERGLAYTVYSSPSAYTDAGTLLVYAGTAPDHAAEVLGLLHGALDDLAAAPIDPEELAVATGYLAGSTVLGLEDTSSHMERLGWSTLMEGRVPPIDEVLDRFRAVTVDDVSRIARRLLDGAPRAVAAVGPISKKDLGAIHAA